MDVEADREEAGISARPISIIALGANLDRGSGTDGDCRDVLSEGRSNAPG
jgi:hypothetical protein